MDSSFGAAATGKSDSGLPDSLKAALHPYYRTLLEAYAAAGRPYFHQVTPSAARAMLRAGLVAAPPQTDLPELADVHDEAVFGPNGPVPVRRYLPNGEMRGIVVFMHAGGWVIGDMDLSDALCRRLAAGAGCEVVSVEYRLAPEHPYPEPLDDAYAVVEWAAKQERGPVVVAGESAGGNLAAACAIRARDSGGPRLAGQLLAYPVTNNDFTTASYREVGPRNWLLSTADMVWFWDQYCPPSVDRTHPLVSPLRVLDPAGLPPALIYVAELDPLRDEGLAYAARLDRGGTPVRTRCEPGMLHGFLAAAGAVPTVGDAVREAAEWIKNRMLEARE